MAPIGHQDEYVSEFQLWYQIILSLFLFSIFHMRECGGLNENVFH